MTTVEYVTVLELFTNVDVLIFQKETVTVMETNLMYLEYVEVVVQLTRMPTEYVTT